MKSDAELRKSAVGTMQALLKHMKAQEVDQAEALFLKCDDGEKVRAFHERFTRKFKDVATRALGIKIVEGKEDGDYAVVVGVRTRSREGREIYRCVPAYLMRQDGEWRVFHEPASYARLGLVTLTEKDWKHLGGMSKWYEKRKKELTEAWEKKKAKEAQSEDYSLLGKKYLAALQSGRPADAMSCWVSAARMKKLMNDPPKGFPKASPQERKLYPAHVKERNGVIAKVVPNIIRTLKGEGIDPMKLTFVKADAVEYLLHFGIPRMRTLKMVYKTPDGALVELSVDNVMKLDGKWLFHGKPSASLQLTKDGKTRLLMAKD